MGSCLVRFLRETDLTSRGTSSYGTKSRDTIIIFENNVAYFPTPPYGRKRGGTIISDGVHLSYVNFGKIECEGL